jgi:DNA-directed RNA polymerase subunit RPC12/RpoP
MRQPTNQPVIFPKIDPIVCPECGGKAGLMRRTPDPENPLAEIRTFECVDCGNQTELKAE